MGNLREHIGMRSHRFFDPTNRRLIYLRSAATNAYWDKHWDNEEAKVPVNQSKLKTLLRYLLGRDYVCKTTAQFIPSGGTILEGGCGLGQHIKSLSKLGYRATGVDFAEKTVAKVKQLDPLLDIRVGDVRKLPFERACFDGYWSLGVIEHFWNGFNDIALEMARVIRPEGYLFLTFPSMSWLRIIKARRGKYPIWNQTEEPNNFYQFALDVDSVVQTIEQSGFTFVTKKWLDGSKGMRDELLINTSLKRRLQSSSGYIRGLNALTDVLCRRWCGHISLLVFRRK